MYGRALLRCGLLTVPLSKSLGKLPFILANQCIWTSALVSDDIEEVMLGADLLAYNQCIWNFGSGVLSVNGHPAVTWTHKGHNKCRRVLVHKPLEIPPGSQMDVPARMTKLSMQTPLDDMVETRV